MNLSVIIPIQNEESTLSAVLEELVKIEPYEIIAVLNGSTDGSEKIAEAFECRKLVYKEPLGVDIGRAIGAREAKGDTLLFIDGDIVVRAQELQALLDGIRDGADIALNDLSWTMKRPIRPHPTAVSKFSLNHFLGKGELSVNSLVAVPHVMKKSALDTIGWENLACPPLAHSIAVMKELKMSAPVAIDVIATNKIRPKHQQKITGSSFSFSTSLIIGDHLRAVAQLIEERGYRGGLNDGRRNRQSFKEYVQAFSVKEEKRAKYSAIIPVGKEPDTIAEVIAEVKKAGIDEIIVVLNGADERTKEKVEKSGVKVIAFDQALGHNIPRAIGALHSTGDICLFLDSDFVIKAENLTPFIHAVEEGADIALNDLEILLDRAHPLHSVSAAKYLLNMALKREDLTVNSLTAIPHSMSRKVIDEIGILTLMSPPLFQAKAILKGFKVESIHYVDVVKPNKIRKQHHRQADGRVESTDRILGDHIEAFSYLLSFNQRCGYTDGNRKWDMLQGQIDRVAVIGLGYVGLPLALHLAKKGCHVTGIDQDTHKIELLQQGSSYIPDVKDEELQAVLNFIPKHTDAAVALLKAAEYIIVTVPTPIDEHHEPDLRAMIAVTNYLCQYLQTGQTIIYESSTYPGTVEEVIEPIFTRQHFKAGKDYYLCYSPERIDPANKQYTLASIPKVISGQTESSLAKIDQFYAKYFAEVVPVSSPKVAELAKLFENTQRLVNISLVNELDELCERLDIDFYEALQAAATKPFGFTPYWPGPGIGGHCIPVDPIYLQWKLNQYGLSSQLVAAAREINDTMPQKIVKKVEAELAGETGAILVVGLAYKRDVNDVRESPALTIFNELLQKGYQVDYHDPYVPTVVLENKSYQSVPLTNETLSKYQLTLLLTDHSNLDYKLLSKVENIIDTRHVLKTGK